jgi:DNA-binding MarR family transcriptional regulator
MSFPQKVRMTPQAAREFLSKKGKSKEVLSALARDLGHDLVKGHTSHLDGVQSAFQQYPPATDAYLRGFEDGLHALMDASTTAMESRAADQELLTFAQREDCLQLLNCVRDAPLRLSEVAARLQRDRAGIMRKVDKLVSAGLIESPPRAETGSNVRWVQLAPRGLRVLDEAERQTVPPTARLLLRTFMAVVVRLENRERIAKFSLRQLLAENLAETALNADALEPFLSGMLVNAGLARDLRTALVPQSMEPHALASELGQSIGESGEAPAFLETLLKGCGPDVSVVIRSELQEWDLCIHRWWPDDIRAQAVRKKDIELGALAPLENERLWFVYDSIPAFLQDRSDQTLAPFMARAERRLLIGDPDLSLPPGVELVPRVRLPQVALPAVYAEA